MTFAGTQDGRATLGRRATPASPAPKGESVGAGPLSVTCTSVDRRLRGADRLARLTPAQARVGHLDHHAGRVLQQVHPERRLAGGAHEGGRRPLERRVEDDLGDDGRRRRTPDRTRRTPRRRCRTGSPRRSGSPGGRRRPRRRRRPRCPGTTPCRRTGRPTRASPFRRPRTPRGRSRPAGRPGCRAPSPRRPTTPRRCRARRSRGSRARPWRRPRWTRRRVALSVDGVEDDGSVGVPTPASGQHDGRGQRGSTDRAAAVRGRFLTARASQPPAPRPGVRHGGMYCFLRPRRTTSPHRLVVQDAALSRR